jgi:hypothetical protein
MASKSVDLLNGAAATAGDKTSVDVGGKTPFLPGRKVRVIFDAEGQSGTAPAWAVDGSDDDTTWTADIATSVVAAGSEAVEAVAYRYMRASVTTAAGTTAGTLSVRLEGLD